MKNSYVFVFLLLAGCQCYAGSTAKKRSTFVEKDIFQSTYFLKNTPGLIPDCHGLEVRYFADRDGISVFLTDVGLVYRVTQKDDAKIKKIKEQQREKNQKLSESGEGKEEEKWMPTISSYASVNWIDANPHPLIEAIGQNSGYYTFLAGQTGIKPYSIMTNGYEKVIYHDLYPNIDMEFTLPERGGMKYNFIIHPGGDVSKIRMEYGGSVKKLTKDQYGNILIHTETGDIMEHAPLSYTADGGHIVSSYIIRGTTVRFSVSGSYDHRQTLIVDPWITALTQLTPRNLGTSVDYDVTGNTYVYGAGGNSALDSTFHKVAKYDLSGNFLWVFMGSVPSIGWSTESDVGNVLASIRVDKITDKTYIGHGYTQIGVQAIRLTPGGLYDNFESIGTDSLTEIWSFVFNCSTGSVLVLGGGPTSNHDIGVMDTTGLIGSGEITNAMTGEEDVVSATTDPFGNVYVLIASAINTQANNYIYKMAPPYLGSIWSVPSGYLSFTEDHNMPAFDPVNTSSNCFNALAANGSYLYYYDGTNLQAMDENSGSVVGTPYSLGGTNSLSQGGIAVDRCNNIYVGGIGAIKTFTFNGSVFNPGSDISLGGAFAGDSVFDVKFNASNNLLYVTGAQMVGTFPAILSANCTVSNTFSTTVSSSCGSATVHITTASGLNGGLFSYVWMDSSGMIIRQTASDTLLYDTLSNVPDGQYSVQIQYSLNCGGSAVTDSFKILCNGIIHTPNAVICSGQPVTLHAQGLPPGGTFSWSPVSSSTDSITVSPSANTIYSVTYHSPAGVSYTDTIRVTLYPDPSVGILPADTIFYPGDTVQLNASASHLLPIITSYLWSPSSGLSCSQCPDPVLHTSSLTDSLYIYSLQVTDTNGCEVTIADTIKVEFPAQLAIPDAFSPNGDGKNDTFFILARSADDFNMNIYNRWGQKVFASTDITRGWDGTYQGKPQPEGEYLFFFTIHFADGKSQSRYGTLTLFR